MLRRASGKRLITGDSRGITLWDAETGQKLLSIRGEIIVNSAHAAMFSPDGTRIPLRMEKGLEILDGTPLPEPTK